MEPSRNQSRNCASSLRLARRMPARRDLTLRAPRVPARCIGGADNIIRAASRAAGVDRTLCTGFRVQETAYAPSYVSVCVSLSTEPLPVVAAARVRRSALNFRRRKERPLHPPSPWSRAVLLFTCPDPRSPPRLSSSHFCISLCSHTSPASFFSSSSQPCRPWCSFAASSVQLVISVIPPFFTPLSTRS